MDPRRVAGLVPLGRDARPRARPRRRRRQRRHERAESHGPLAHPRHAEATTSSHPRLRRGWGRPRSGRRGHERRDRRRGRGQPGRLTRRRDHRLGQRQPDGSRLRHLGRARSRRPCQLRHRPRPQHRPSPTEPHMGGVRGLPALLPDGVADAAPGPARSGRHPLGRGHRRRGRHRHARARQRDGCARLRHVARPDQARPRDRARSRRRVRLGRIEVAGHGGRRRRKRGASDVGAIGACAEGRGAGSCCVEAPRGCRSS